MLKNFTQLYNNKLQDKEFQLKINNIINDSILTPQERKDIKAQGITNKDIYKYVLFLFLRIEETIY